MSDATNVFFVTDIHGSTICFRKFLGATSSKRPPDVLIVGADISGKYIVPVVEVRPFLWEAAFGGEIVTLTDKASVENFENTIADRGGYAWKCDPEKMRHFVDDIAYRDSVMLSLKSMRLKAWVELADTWLAGSDCQVFISGGNDDPWSLDTILKGSKSLICPEGEIVRIGRHLRMLSTGVANTTPWNCPRDVSEDEVAARIDAMAQRCDGFSNCIFNIHCPPYDTLLDRAPKLDSQLRMVTSAFGIEMESVGSRSVRAAIEKYQPVVSLHGHIHESRGFQRIGRTFCVNPGSEYSIGKLAGVFLHFRGPTLDDFEMVVD